mgnify:FL=1
MITAEHWMEGINSVLDEYGLSREEFWKAPEAFINNLEDKDAKLTLEFYMQIV